MEEKYTSLHLARSNLRSNCSVLLPLPGQLWSKYGENLRLLGEIWSKTPSPGSKNSVSREGASASGEQTSVSREEISVSGAQKSVSREQHSLSRERITVFGERISVSDGADLRLREGNADDRTQAACAPEDAAKTNIGTGGCQTFESGGQKVQRTHVAET